MKKYLISLATISLSLSLYGMRPENIHQPQSYSNPYRYTGYNEYQAPYLMPDRKERKLALKEQKMMLEEGKLCQQQVNACIELLRDYDKIPIIKTTPETRRNAALFLETWSHNLTANQLPEFKK